MSKFCKYCGAPRVRNAKFCNKCGAVLAGKSSGKKKLYAAVISFVLVLALVLTAFWKPGFFYMLKGDKLSGESSEIAHGINAGNQPVPEMAETDVFTGPDGLSQEENEQLSAKYEEAMNTGSGLSLSWSDAEIAAAPAATTPVSPGNTSVEAGGVRADFGEFNVTDNTEFTVRSLPNKDIGDPDVLNTASYDLSLGETDEFIEPVTVQLPYNPTTAGSFPVVQHFDETKGVWQYEPTKYNAASGTLDVSLTHFSPVTVEEYINKEYVELQPDIHFYIDPNQEVENYLSTIDTSEDPKYSTYDSAVQAHAKNLYENLSQTSNPVTIGGVALSISKLRCSSFAGQVSKAFLFYKNTISYFDDVVGDMGLAITMFQVFTDYLDTQSVSDTVAKNWIAIAGAAGSMVFTGGTLAVFTVCMYVVSLISDYEKLRAADRYDGYASASEWGYRQYNDELYYFPSNSYVCGGSNMRWMISHKNHIAYTKYLKKYGPGRAGWLAEWRFACKECNPDYAEYVKLSYNDCKGWAVVLRDCKKKYGSKDALKHFEMIVDSYCWTFWNQDYLIKNSYAVLANSRAVGTYPSMSTLRQYANSMKKDVMDCCDAMIRKFLREQIEEGKKAVYNSFMKMNEQFNRELRFETDIRDKDGNELTLSQTAYKNNFIIMDTRDKKVKQDTPWVIDKDKKQVFACTAVAYSLAGDPQQLLIYKDEASYQKDEAPIATLPFTLADPVTTIKMNVNDDIFGTWDLAMNIGGLSSQMSEDMIREYEKQMQEALENGEDVDMSQVEALKEQYAQAMQNALGDQKGTMVITDLGKDDSTGVHSVSATVTYASAPGQVTNYSGTYDEKSRKLVLKNTNQQMLDPGLDITITPGNPLTFTTELSYDSYGANYSAVMKGTKLEE